MMGKTSKVTDAKEAKVLSFRPDYIDIYSCAWGPGDNGVKVDGPRPLTSLAIQNGVKHVSR